MRCFQQTKSKDEQTCARIMTGTTLSQTSFDTWLGFPIEPMICNKKHSTADFM